MSSEIELWQTTAIAASQVARSSAAGEAVLERAKVLMQTQAAEDAVLRPKDQGRWSHCQRAALAARIATLNEDMVLQECYLRGCRQAPEAALADLSENGSTFHLRDIVTFMDRVASQPRDVEAGDIQLLKDAGIADADIVRLCELNAFISYQIRLVAGLRLLASESQ